MVFDKHHDAGSQNWQRLFVLLVLSKLAPAILSLCTRKMVLYFGYLSTLTIMLYPGTPCLQSMILKHIFLHVFT